MSQMGRLRYDRLGRFRAASGHDRPFATVRYRVTHFATKGEAAEGLPQMAAALLPKA
jgi:hypothetical protein